MGGCFILVIIMQNFVLGMMRVGLAIRLPSGVAAGGGEAEWESRQPKLRVPMPDGNEYGDAV